MTATPPSVAGPRRRRRFTTDRGTRRTAQCHTHSRQKENPRSTRTVTTQQELDQAIEDGVGWVDIRSERGVWLEVRACGSSTVTAYGSSTVRAYESSTVTACGSSTVTACESSTVTACDFSTVTAYDFSTVTAYESSTVTACGSSTVRAHGSSTVRAYDSSTVTAYGSSTVRAYGSSTVRAYGSSTVTAGSGVAVHLHNARAKITGGFTIDHTHESDMTTEQWCDHHGVTITDGIAYLYKAVDGQWTTARGFDYSPGSTPSAPDWRDDQERGGGLHFSPTPSQALAYNLSATRFVRVGVAVETLRPIFGGAAKAKAPAVVVACVAVDEAMREL